MCTLVKWKINILVIYIEKKISEKFNYDSII